MTRAHYVAAAALAALTLTACGDDDDTNARADLSAESQMNDVSAVRVAVLPDGFPNVAHKCMDFGDGPPVGMYTTTDRTVIIIYNDHVCPGSNVEQEMTVINAIPRSVLGTGTP